MRQRSVNSYTAEFKESAVKLATETHQPITQTARELGVKANTLYTWINKYQGQPRSGAAKQEGQHLYDELKQLGRRN